MGMLQYCDCWILTYNSVKIIVVSNYFKCSLFGHNESKIIIDNILIIFENSLCPGHLSVSWEDAEMTILAFGSKTNWPFTGNTISHTLIPWAGMTTGTAVSSWNTVTSTEEGTWFVSQLTGSSKSTLGVHFFTESFTTPVQYNGITHFFFSYW